MRRQPLVAGNWKMNGSLAANQRLVDQLVARLSGEQRVDVAVCVPYPYLDQVSRLLRGSCVQLAAQDVSSHGAGAYTGEVSAAMLQDFGCRYVLIGHSERRSLHGETDALVAEKFAVVQQAGMVPVLCLGETLMERQSGATLSVVFRQLDAVLARVGVAQLAGAVLAYEPVWAIGTGLTATPEQAQEVHRALRQHVEARDAGVAAALRIVYGGSVKADNAGRLFAQPDVDGGLVGGASLDAEDFLAICQAANF
ncbi:triose-phosphate isomerase [Azovibrio restrictus]|uniref:triose-phosphate isomerase n=1 Tax=Azovibrio restrictus TaxID=146938 RepID=UPI0026EFE0E1|nr:triose-phosphate isomerase [Azovibrio restrictus]